MFEIKSFANTPFNKYKYFQIDGNGLDVLNSRSRILLSEYLNTTRSNQNHLVSISYVIAELIHHFNLEFTPNNFIETRTNFRRLTKIQLKTFFIPSRHHAPGNKLDQIHFPLNPRLQSWKVFISFLSNFLKHSIS